MLYARTAEWIVAISSAAEIPLPLMSPTASISLSELSVEKIIVVAADCARRTAEPVHFERLKLRDQLGIELRLHFLRDGQFAFQALLFLLFLHQFLDRCGHRVEGIRQRPPTGRLTAPQCDG